MGNYIHYVNKEDANTIAMIYSKSFQQAFKRILPDDFLKEKFAYKHLQKMIIKNVIIQKM